jgi:hypothetical protein
MAGLTSLAIQTSLTVMVNGTGGGLKPGKNFRIEVEDQERVPEIALFRELP